MSKESFEWDNEKDLLNQTKHGVSFKDAQYAFTDNKRVIAEDLSHSDSEKRYYCFGNVNGGILTVRFTYRDGAIRIFGAGYWRKGKKIYERENQIH
ncbi:MAG: BrnT family toxin [Arenicellales bacterium]